MRETLRMRLASLHVYPIKSCAGVRVEALALDAHGAVDDRRFMVVDATGRFVSLRTEPRLGLVEVALAADTVEARLPSGARLTLPRAPEGPRVAVRVWDDDCTGVLLREASSAFSSWLGAEVRLVGFPHDAPRAFTAPQRGPHGTLDFADAFPLLALSVASVEAVCAAAGVPTDARRFRPNLLFDDVPAFAEDELADFRVGELPLTAPKLCSRCVAVDVDPSAGRAAPGVLAALARTRRTAGKVWLGTNVVHLETGTLRVADPVVVTRRHAVPPLG